MFVAAIPCLQASCRLRPPTHLHIAIHWVGAERAEHLLSLRHAAGGGTGSSAVMGSPAMCSMWSSTSGQRAVAQGHNTCAAATPGAADGSSAAAPHTSVAKMCSARHTPREMKPRARASAIWPAPMNPMRLSKACLRRGRRRASVSTSWVAAGAAAGAAAAGRRQAGGGGGAAEASELQRAGRRNGGQAAAGRRHLRESDSEWLGAQAWCCNLSANGSEVRCSADRAAEGPEPDLHETAAPMQAGQRLQAVNRTSTMGRDKGQANAGKPGPLSVRRNSARSCSRARASGACTPLQTVVL